MPSATFSVSCNTTRRHCPGDGCGNKDPADPITFVNAGFGFMFWSLDVFEEVDPGNILCRFIKLERSANRLSVEWMVIRASLRTSKRLPPLIWSGTGSRGSRDASSLLHLTSAFVTSQARSGWFRY